MGPGRSRPDAMGHSGKRGVRRGSSRAKARAAPGPRRRIPSSSDKSGTRAAATDVATTDKRAPGGAAGGAASARSWRQPAKQLAHTLDHLRRRPHAVGWPHQHIERPELRLLQPKGFANASLDPISLGGLCGVLARYENAEPRRSRIAPREVKDIAGLGTPRSVMQQAFELAFTPQPALGVEPVEFLSLRYNDYNPRRRRPRARRLRSTARPPRVRLRTKKPWRRARRVLDGW